MDRDGRNEGVSRNKEEGKEGEVGQSQSLTPLAGWIL